MMQDIEARKAKPKDKPYKLADERGLYLLVTPTGGKLWRFDYRFEGKRKTLAFGGYPDVSLADAREKRDEARKLLAQEIDPSAKRKAEKTASADTFEAVTREWHVIKSNIWTPSYARQVMTRMEADIFPELGAKPLSSITAPELLVVFRKIEARGVHDTAHRLLQCVRAVFAYAVAAGRAERNPASDLSGTLIPVGRRKHRASIHDPKAIGELLRAFDSFTGSEVVKAALNLAALVFVRPGELRKAEWAEIDLEASEWRIPAEKMKMRAKHIVPLSRQAVAILAELKNLTGAGRYVFPSFRTPNGDKPMSENAVLAALRRLGYSKDEMTGHGFRSMASTLLNEQGWNKDAIERQLAHAERDEIRAAYNHAEHLPERRRMMQAWADYLDGLKQGADVVPFKKQA
jgi:integrase